MDGHVHSHNEKLLKRLLTNVGFYVVKIYGFESNIACNRFTAKLPHGIRMFLDNMAYKMLNTAKYIMCLAYKIKTGGFHSK